MTLPRQARCARCLKAASLPPGRLTCDDCYANLRAAVRAYMNAAPGEPRSGLAIAVLQAAEFDLSPEDAIEAAAREEMRDGRG